MGLGIWLKCARLTYGGVCLLELKELIETGFTSDEHIMRRILEVVQLYCEYLTMYFAQI